MKVSNWALIVAGVMAMFADSADAQSKYENVEPTPRDMATMLAMTPESVAAVVEVQDDDLEPAATLTTAKAFVAKGKFTDAVRSDNFFRAFIDKKTGQVRFQLYETINYDFVARDFTTVNYATQDGPQTALLDLNDHDVRKCELGCFFKDTLGFNVPPDHLKSIAGQYVAGNSPLWRFKYRSKAGLDWEDRIAPAEAAGLLIAVRKYLESHKLPPI